MRALRAIAVCVSVTVRFEEVHVDLEPDGPPPTPLERARQRSRRRWLVGVVVVALVALAVPVVVMLVNALDLDLPRAAPDDPGTDDSSEETSDPDGMGSDEDAPPDDATERRRGTDDRTFTDADRPDPEVPDDDRIDVPDAAAFDGVSAIQVRLLTDIDASERAMIAFQLAASDAFIEMQDLDELRARISESAGHALDDLYVLRWLLERPIDDEPTAGVRERYVEHLDTWLDYLEAVEETPDVLFAETTRYTVPINLSGARFTEQIEALVAGDVDPEVRRVAEAIVERGFGGPEQSQV